MTSPPKFLTEADLISLMEKNGIGTDATHADHIDTIKSREYVGLHENIYFVPAVLGMGLVEGYDNIGLEVSLAKPILRSDFEKDLKLICDGAKDPQIVLREQKEKYRAMFQNVYQSIQEIEVKLSERLQEQRTAVENMEYQMEAFQNVLNCPKCGCDMVIRKKKTGNGFYIGCCGFPECRNAIWLPPLFEHIQATTVNCQRCGENVKKIKVKFKQGQNPFLGEPNEQTLCIGGCDENVLQIFDISPGAVRRRGGNEVQINNGNYRPPPPPPPGGGVRIQPNNQRNENRQNDNRNRQHWNERHDSDSDDDDSGNGPGINVNSRTTFNHSQRKQHTQTNQRNNPNMTQNVLNQTIQMENINCECGTAAVLLTVRKEGLNTGRKFFKCNTGVCNFFKWADEEGSNNQSLNKNQTLKRPPNNQQTNHTVFCNCGQPASQRIVQKDNENKGRSFYTCSGTIDSRCNFFQWASDAEAGVGTSTNSTNHRNSNNWQNNKKRKKPQNKNNKKQKVQLVTGNQQDQKKSRKCGICGENGHNRKNCPNK